MAKQRLWCALPFLARMDIAASFTVAAMLSLWLTWHS
jgi:hypothetical protein